MGKIKSYFPLIIFSIILLLCSCARNPVTGKKQLVFMSEKQEIAMGQQADPQIVASFGLYEDSALQNYITEKGLEMAEISHRKKLAYEFKILDSPIINAFAVPGGFVYFTRGIMAHFNNEAEFAGVLGHEIGHITARHSVVQQRNQLLGQLGLIAGVVAVPELAQFAEPASQGLGLLLMKFGRDAERQSDELGVEYSSKIGYDAQEMAGFFNTLHRSSGGSEGAIPEFLSTHPSPEDRLVAVSELAEKWQQKLDLNDPKVKRDTYLQMIDGIIYGEDPKQGFVENQIFYHPELVFQFPIPDGWIYQNSPQQFQMAPKEGNALMSLSLAPGSSLEQAANAILENYNLTLKSSDELTVNGFPAMSLVAEQVQEQMKVKTLIYLIKYDDIIYNIMGVTLSTEYNNYQPLFRNTMQNFKRLTDKSKINKQPERVEIKTVNSTASLSNVLQGFNVPQSRLDELAILNGMELSDQVPKGTMIKIVE